MKTNYVDPSRSQPSFQMRFVLKKYWNPDILKAMEDSKLVREIDKKFPNAAAYFDSYVNDQRVNNTAVIIKLNNKSVLKISAVKKYILNPKEDFPAINAQLIEKIKNTSLEDLLISIAKNRTNMKNKVATVTRADMFNKTRRIYIKDKFVWNIKVLNEFMDSKLAKDLNKTYPGSKIAYKTSFVNNVENKASLTITNAKKQKCIFSAISSKPDADLIKIINSTDIAGVSKEFDDYQKLKQESRSTLVKSLRKIFHLD